MHARGASHDHPPSASAMAGPSRPRSNTATMRGSPSVRGYKLSDPISPESKSKRDPSEKRHGRSLSAFSSTRHPAHSSDPPTHTHSRYASGSTPYSPISSNASTPTKARFGTLTLAPRALFTHALRRLARAARRLGFLAAVLFVSLYFLTHDQARFNLTARWGRPEPQCSFVSTVDAYHRDLARLRAEFGTNLPPRKVPRSKQVHADARRGHFNSSTAHDHSSHDQSHQHVYSPTGHLLFSDDPDAPHPIPLLLTLGEERWDDLLSAQSRTLDEAVAEYEDRYGRRPPRGFDKWWEFAVDNDVVLPDEYDGINLDLAPFWALPKHELRKRMQWVEDMPEVFIIDITNGTVSIEINDEGGLAWGGTGGRAKQTAQLLQTLAEYLPDLRATFSIFDQPQIYLSWARRDSLVNLGLKGAHTSHLAEVDDGRVRLSRSCAPDSPFRTSNSTRAGRSLVYDSGKASDLCSNPYLVPLHGLTIEAHEPDSHPRPHSQLLPLFSLAKTSINSDILITPLEQFERRPARDRVWEKKRDPRLAWRGSPTGISMMSKDVDWRNSHRWRLHLFANNASNAETEVMLPYIDEEGAEGRGMLGMKTEKMPADGVADWFFDIHLTGGPLQCDENDGTCDEMENEIHWANFQLPREAQESKFLLDIDGNGWSGRFRRLMSTNSVVIKTGIFTEWFQPHLIPWFMYVPSKLDFSDLADIMAFFTGSPSQPGLAFDETAKALGQNGKCFVQRMFRYADLQAYMLRLFLEYARIVADEGVDMDYHHTPSYEEGVRSEQDEGEPTTDSASGIVIDIGIDHAAPLDGADNNIGMDATQDAPSPDDAPGDAEDGIPRTPDLAGSTPEHTIVDPASLMTGFGTDEW